MERQPRESKYNRARHIQTYVQAVGASICERLVQISPIQPKIQTRPLNEAHTEELGIGAMSVEDIDANGNI